jgi:hypothetical protein
VVVSLWDEKVECVFARVPARSVTAVMAQGDCLNQGHIDSDPASDRGRHLSDLKGVCQPGALVIGRKDNNLGLAGEPPEGRGMHNPIAIMLETGALVVRLLCDGAIPRSLGEG